MVLAKRFAQRRRLRVFRLDIAIAIAITILAAATSCLRLPAAGSDIATSHREASVEANSER